PPVTILQATPAKAGTHRSTARAIDKWAPACAGVEERDSPNGAVCPLARDAQKSRSVAAEHSHAVGVADAGLIEDVVNRGRGPRERMVGAHDDLADPAFGDQMAQSLGGEHHRVDIELLAEV